MLSRQIIPMLAEDGWVRAHAANAGAATERQSPAQTIIVLSASKAARHSPSRQTAVISIRGSGEPELPLSSLYRAVVRLIFNDISEFAERGPGTSSISPEQARAVAVFVREHGDADALLLHCAAGVSLSRSMAAAICDVRNLPYRWTVVNNQVYGQVRCALLAPLDAHTPHAPEEHAS
jgi:hypothetical protein